MNYEEKVRLNVMMGARVNSKYEWLPKRDQMQLDTAIAIVRDGFNAELVKGLESCADLGMYLFHCLETDLEMPVEAILNELAAFHLQTSEFLTAPAYQVMLATTALRLESRELDVTLFARELVGQTVNLDHSKIIKLLGFGSGSVRRRVNGEDFSQGLILKELLKREDGKELLIKNLPKPDLGKLVRKYDLGGLEGVISRKDAGHLLSDRLGL